MPVPILGRPQVTELLLGGFTPHPGLEPDPGKAPGLIIRHLEEKRRGLGWDARTAL